MSAHTQGRLQPSTALITINGVQGEFYTSHKDGTKLVVAITGSIGAGDDVESIANARRLAACWNAFDGVDTDKIEGKSVAEYVCQEAYLTGLQPAPGAAGLNIALSGIACQMFADSFAGQFKGSGAINFLEVGMTHKELGDFIVTIQRVHGETPAQQKAAALAELAAAQTRIEALETKVREQDAMLGRRPCQNERCNELGAARALLAEIDLMDDNGDVALGDVTSQFASLAGRIHTFLKPKPAESRDHLAPIDPWEAMAALRAAHAEAMAKADARYDAKHDAMADALALLADILASDDESQKEMREASIELGLDPDAPLARTERIRALLKGAP